MQENIHTIVQPFHVAMLAKSGPAASDQRVAEPWQLECNISVQFDDAGR